jgi:hypothetical protein
VCVTLTPNRISLEDAEGAADGVDVGDDVGGEGSEVGLMESDHTNHKNFKTRSAV